MGVGAWGQGGTRAPAESYFAEWADEEGFHSPWRMCNELGRRFVERLFEWVPYLYSDDLGEGVSESDERAAIEAGTINATGFRYVGIRRALAEPLGHGPGEATHALIHKVRRREILRSWKRPLA